MFMEGSDDIKHDRAGGVHLKAIRKHHVESDDHFRDSDHDIGRWVVAQNVAFFAGCIGWGIGEGKEGKGSACEIEIREVSFVINPHKALCLLGKEMYPKMAIRM